MTTESPDIALSLSPAFWGAMADRRFCGEKMVSTGFAFSRPLDCLVFAPSRRHASVRATTAGASDPARFEAAEWFGCCCHDVPFVAKKCRKTQSNPIKPNQAQICA